MENLSARILETLAAGASTIGKLAKTLSTEAAPVTSKDLRKDLRDLRKDGKITVAGAKRSATYELTK